MYYVYTYINCKKYNKIVCDDDDDADDNSVSCALRMSWTHLPDIVLFYHHTIVFWVDKLITHIEIRNFLMYCVQL